MADEVERLRGERDFYKRMLDLDQAEDVEPLLAGALELALDVLGAQQGYISFGDDHAWSLARGFSGDEQAAIRRAISGGIMAQAIASGAPIVTHSALLDPRFAGMQSVRRNRLESVMCVPIGSPVPGALYLQGRREAGPFGADDLERAQVFARHLAPLADRLIARARAAAPDPVGALRERLNANHLIGRSDALAQALRQVSLVAPLEIGVLLTGPTGTGKSALAKVIVDNSPRKNGPFVEVNCAAFPDALIEAELFGARRGAYTGAMADRPGRFGAASGGTLFLDEVAELSPAAQAKLLQVLQSGQYYAVGDDTQRVADVRVLSATNVDLDRAVAEGAFRADLLYRLATFRIRVPGLHERREDIALIAEAGLGDACARYGLPRLRFAPSGRAALEGHPWRGHVRELLHHVGAAAVRAAGEGLEAVEARHLFPDAVAAGPLSSRKRPGSSSASSCGTRWRRPAATSPRRRGGSTSPGLTCTR